jgi:hypothetical protein
MSKSNLVIVTLATHAEGYFDALKTACANCNVRFVSLGWGEEWRGYGWKFNSMKSFLLAESEANKQRCLYVFVDGFDVIADISSEQNVIERYYAVSGGKIMVGINARPRNGTEMVQSWLDKQIFGKCFNRSLNSGVYAGSNEQLLDFLEICSKEGASDDDDDQRLLVKACKKNTEWFKDNVYFDDDANFVLNVTCAISASSKHRFLETRRLRSSIFYHGAGSCDMDDLARALNLPTYRKIERSNRHVFKRLFGKGGYARYAIRSSELMFLLIVFFVILICISQSLLRISRRK